MSELRDVRLAAGLTLRQAAMPLGIDYTYLSKVEHGRDRPSDDLVRRMGGLYGWDPERWLLDRAVDDVPAHVRSAIIRSAIIAADADTLDAAWREASDAVLSLGALIEVRLRALPSGKAIASAHDIILGGVSGTITATTGLDSPVAALRALAATVRKLERGEMERAAP